MFPLRYTDFFQSPVWKIPWKIFHRGRKLFADPAAGGDCFLAPMSSPRYNVAFDFFLSPNAYHPWRRFQHCKVLAISTWRYMGGGGVLLTRKDVSTKGIIGAKFAFRLHRGRQGFSSAPMFPPALRLSAARTGRNPVHPSRPRTAGGVVT